MLGMFTAGILATLIVHESGIFDEPRVVSTELGMSEAELLERSTYPFDPERADRVYKMTSYGFAGPFDFIFTLDGRELRFDEIGPRNITNRVVFEEDQLYGIDIYPHEDGQTIDDVLSLAEDVERWFESAGFSPSEGLRIRRSLDPATRPEVRHGDDLRTLLRDLNIVVAEMVVYSATRDDLWITVVASNSRRLRHTSQRRDERYPIDDRDDASWLVSISFSGRYGRLISGQ